MIRHPRNPRVGAEEQRRQLAFLRQLNASHQKERGADALLEACIQALETAYQMQTAAGAAFDLRREPAPIRDAYGPGPFATG